MCNDICELDHEWTIFHIGVVSMIPRYLESSCTNKVIQCSHCTACITKCDVHQRSSMTDEVLL